MKRIITRIVELLAVLTIGAFLMFALSGEAPEATETGSYVIANGVAETGASNLVTSIYLGYRAFDTLGETIVLLLAVSGVMFLVGKGRDKEGREGSQREED
ncbi:MAG: hydrogen gas-evolving membrane-bound hydrogenase subunit E [Spirochaetales bacterium]